jgi:hypothetical protein
MNKIVASIFPLILFVNSSLFAQDKEAEMADLLRQSGKIYTVVAVLGIILAGLLAYLILTERRLAKLEKQLNKK